MRRISDAGDAPRYVRAAHEEPPICVSTPSTKAKIVRYLESQPAQGLVAGAATEVLSFVRGIGYEKVRGGKKVLVIQGPAHKTFAPLGIHAASHGAMLTGLEEYDVVVAFNVSSETAEDLAKKVPHLLIALTKQGQRGTAGARAFSFGEDAFELPDYEPSLETV
jgi:hypothetical protein